MWSVLFKVAIFLGLSPLASFHQVSICHGLTQCVSGGCIMVVLVEIFFMVGSWLNDLSQKVVCFIQGGKYYMCSPYRIIPSRARISRVDLESSGWLA